MKRKYNKITRLWRIFIASLIKAARFYERNPEARIYLNMHFHKILLVCMFCTVFSCKSTKRISENVTEKQQSNTEVSKQNDSNNSGTRSESTVTKSDSVSNQSLERIEKLTSDWEARLRKYDTDKPIDSETGTPPLSSELVITNRSTTDKQLTENVNTEKNSSKEAFLSETWLKLLNQKIDSSMILNNELIRRTQVKEKKVIINWWAWMLAGVLSGISIAIFFRKSFLPFLSFYIRK